MKPVPTIAQDLAAYLELKRLTLRPDSYKVYRCFGDKFRAWLMLEQLSDVPTKKFTPATLERYRLYILRMHTDSTTRNKELVQVKMLFNWLAKPAQGRFLVSPAAGLELQPKKDSDLHEPYTEEQVVEIFGEIIKRGDYYLLLYIYLIHYTFARPGREVRLLKVGDIKTRAVVIRPENSKTHRTKTPTIAQPLETLINALGIRNHPKNWFVFGADGTPGPYVVGRNTFYYRHCQILKHLNITGAKYTLYGWKHTGNIRAVQLGISDRTLQQQNGFKEGRTLEIYLRRLSAYANSEIWDKFV